MCVVRTCWVVANRRAWVGPGILAVSADAGGMRTLHVDVRCTSDGKEQSLGTFRRASGLSPKENEHMSARYGAGSRCVCPRKSSDKGTRVFRHPQEQPTQGAGCTTAGQRT